MPKYYCDYCDVFLTHDSPSVRKTHNGGRKHKENVRMFYQKWLEEQAQKLVDATTKAFTQQRMLQQPGIPGMPRMPIPFGMPRPPGMPYLPIPGMPPIMRPGGPPLIPGMPGIPPIGGMPPMMPGGMPPVRPPGVVIPPGVGAPPTTSA